MAGTPTTPLMPKATAVWLVDNTALTFDQIAIFCALHPLEVKGIANGDVAQGIKGIDPITAGQLTRAEIERCQEDPAAHLKLAESKTDLPPPKPQKGGRYTPLSKRQERPDAIAWLVRNHPELNDAEIGRLVGTTKPTIQSIRDRTHWNMSQISPTDPVTLGLCTQIMLDENVTRATRRMERRRKREAREAAKAEEAQNLQQAEDTTSISTPTGTDDTSDTATSASPFAGLAQLADTPDTETTQESDTPNTDNLRPEDVFGKDE